MAKVPAVRAGLGHNRVRHVLVCLYVLRAQSFSGSDTLAKLSSIRGIEVASHSER